MDNKKILLFSFFLLFLVFGCTTQPPVNEVPEDDEGPSDSDGIDLVDQNNELPVKPVEEEGKVEIVMSKEDYFYGENVKFELYNGTDRDIWYAMNLDGCASGPFYIADEDNTSYLLESPADCASSSLTVELIEPEQSREFVWDLKESLEEYAEYVSEGKYVIYMNYYKGLSEDQLELVDYSSESLDVPKRGSLVGQEPDFCETEYQLQYNIEHCGIEIFSKSFRVFQID